jgi:predicted nucleic acid-binding protein
LDAPLFDRLKRTLDPGESEAIALAIEIGAEAVLIDEADGRAVATALGLKPRGVLGILVDAKKLGLIPEVAPLIVQLRDRIQFRMSSELIRDILHASNEPAIG